MRVAVLSFVILLWTGLHSQTTNQDVGAKIISSGLAVLQTDTVKALSLFRQAVSISRTDGDKKITAEAFLHAAETEMLLDSNVSAIRDYKEAAHLYESIGMYTEAAQTYTSLAKLQSDMALFDEALTSFSQSDAIAQAHELRAIHAANLVGAGIVMTKRGELVNAQQNFVDALKIYESQGDSAGIADAWNGIGVVHWKEGKNTEAMEAYRKALDIRLNLGDSLAIATSYSSIGVICRLQQNFAEGLDYYMKALGIRVRHHDKRGEAQVRFNIGSILTDMHRNEEGLRYYNESYAIKQRIGDQYGFLAYYMNVGELYGSLGDTHKQEEALLSGLGLADSLRAWDYVKSFCADLSGFYAQRGDFEKAYHFQKRYVTLKDSLSSKEKNAELVRLQTEYDLNEKERNIEMLQADQLRRIAQGERDALLKYGLVGIIAVVLLFAAFVVNRTLVLRRTNRALEKSKNLVEERDREKEILLREVHHRVKNNLQLTSSLLNLQAREMKDTDSAQVLKEARDRIKAISLVHQELFSGPGFRNIPLTKYIPDLCNSVVGSNNPGPAISVQYQLDEVSIPLETTVTLGLMLNEIVINALKHAFAPGNESGIIRITCAKVNHEVVVTVVDNGKGMPGDVMNGTRTGFGMKLLQSLGAKHSIRLEFGSQNGTTVSIFVPVKDEQAQS